MVDNILTFQGARVLYKILMRFLLSKLSTSVTWIFFLIVYRFLLWYLFRMSPCLMNLLIFLSLVFVLVFNVKSIFRIFPIKTHFLNKEMISSVYFCITDIDRLNPWYLNDDKPHTCLCWIILTHAWSVLTCFISWYCLANE